MAILSQTALEIYVLQEQQVVVIAEEDVENHRRTTSGNGQASRCHHCCASRMTEIDGEAWQRMRELWFYGASTAKVTSARMQ